MKYGSMSMSLESIANKVKMPIVVVGASAYMILNLLGCNGNATPTPKPTDTPKPSPTATYTPPNTATPKPKSTYELALEKLDYQTAQHWKGVAHDLNSGNAINELVFLPAEGRLALAKDIKAYVADGVISDRELSDLADPDKDGVNSSAEARNGTNPMDPSNSTKEVSKGTFAFVRNLAG